MGDTLTPDLLVMAYMEGLFPMAWADGSIHWYDPNPRAILPLERFHVPARLARTVRQGRFEVSSDRAFRAVMEGCAERDGDTWINDELIEAYTALHHQALAHSIEVWQGEALVGGTYGVALGGLFAAESKFSRVRDASKVALVHLVERLRAGGYTLLDVQLDNPHLHQFGLTLISRHAYKQRLAQALTVPARWPT